MKYTYERALEMRWEIAIEARRAELAITNLVSNALNTINCRFDDFVSLVRDKIYLEKYIAVTCNKEEEFRNKWKFFLSL